LLQKKTKNSSGTRFCIAATANTHKQTKIFIQLPTNQLSNQPTKK
jgi:hypothetical protein